MPIATVRLFGPFDFRLGSELAPPLDSGRAESLLAYLLLHRDSPTPRQRLAFLLWPDSTEAQAQTNLRHVLHTLRRRLPDADRYLDIRARTLRWRPESGYWLDVAAFELLLNPAEPDLAAGPLAESGVDRRLAALRQAVRIYSGDLLEGCYDEWLISDRDRLRQMLVEALAELADLCAARRELSEAISHAERLVRVDPLREQAYLQLMRLHDARGDRAAAIRVYHICSSTMERELGVEPSGPTQAAYEALLPRQPDIPPAAPPRTVGPPLVGRAPERARLAATWQSAESGQTQFVVVSGEPGVGKTRLVEELRAWAARRGAESAEARCYPAEGRLAYGPVVTWLRSEVVRPRLPRLDRAQLTEIARLLPELLVENPDLESPAPLPESEQRHRLFDAVSAAIALAGSPLLLAVDDLHHGDQETCQLLHYLLRVRPAARLMVVATARSAEIDDQPMHDLITVLRARQGLTEIELSALSRSETAALAGRLAKAALSSVDARLLYRETEGNPLFVVEAVRAGWKTGQSLTPRVQAVIEARLDQLSRPAQDLVGAAAAVGRTFSVDLLATVTDVDEITLVRNLDELWRRRIVREQGRDAFGDSYDFTHDKIREVAYLAVGPARRRLLHARLAPALEQRHAADPGPVSAEIAAHYEHAGAVEPAISWYRRAAESAQLLHANTEAVRMLARALELIPTLPASGARDRAELQVRTALLAPLISIEAYVSPGVSATQERAVELAQALGVSPTPPLLRSLAMSALTRSDFAAATEFGEQLRQAGERERDDVLVVEAAYVLGIASFWQAEFEDARRFFELAVERYLPERRLAHLLHYGQDPRVVCQTRLGNTLWHLGLADEARSAMAAGLAWADEIKHPFSRGAALTFAALLAIDMGDEAGVRRYAAELADAQELLHLRNAVVFDGYLAVLDGNTDAGLTAIRGAIEQAAGSASVPGHLAVLCRVLLAACVASGDAAAAVDAADRLLGMRGAACVWAAVARRVRVQFGLPG